MDSLRSRLNVEELGNRIVPSAFRIVLPVNSALAAQSTGTDSTTPDLQAAKTTGTYALQGVNTGGGSQFQITGTGHIRGFGHFDTSGLLHTVGNAKSGHAGGHITLTNEHGSVTLQMRGHKQKGGHDLPQHFHFEVVSGTGRYKHLTGDGKVHATLTPGADDSQGNYTLKFS